MADQNHPFLRPLWRRVALVAFCALWAGWEFYHRQGFWGMLALGMTGYGAWLYLIAYKPTDAKEPEHVETSAEGE